MMDYVKKFALILVAVIAGLFVYSKWIAPKVSGPAA